MSHHNIKSKIALITKGVKNIGGLIAKDLAVQRVKVIAIHYHSSEN
ncbi:hypothetical protein [Candidatus Nitrosacidococcus tergens]|uniref:Uncharacterized protein n=1 Tax=Candidatus Nitrosacidococcus tergens TaxID=553981 RepID=A0A7G1QB00_9GAMM|nr:hypothetical protein [Candidatus Nitrosacidococcus tergens]CAB1277053.1 protein of unknown function [Candidatus Nitrosacidococcus tergens]